MSEHLNPRRIRPLPGSAGFGVLLLLALAGGAWFGPALLAAPADRVAVEFADGTKTFCVDGGVMDTGVYEPSDQKEAWHATPEEAVQAFEKQIRAYATAAAFSDEARDLLSPSISFKVGENASFTRDGIAYFDTTSKDGKHLEARVVVAQSDSGWSVVETFRCESTIVTDYTRWEQVYNDAVRGSFKPLKDYDELGDEDE